MFTFILGGCVDRHKHIQHHILRRYARLYFQEDLLHIAYATTTPVDSYRRDLWIFLYEVYFVWFLSVYFQCAEYERPWALGLRSLGCGSLWDDYSPRPVGNHKLSKVAHHACSRQYLSAYNGYECIFIPALYGYKEADATANATKDPLSFDVATAVIHFISSCKIQHVLMVRKMISMLIFGIWIRY